MYKGLSYSPQHGSFAFGTNPGPSDLENMVAGRERKVSDLVDQAVFECLLGGNVDVGLTAGIEHFRGYFGAFSEPCWRNSELPTCFILDAARSLMLQVC